MIIILVILIGAVLLAHIISACTWDRHIEYKTVPFHSEKIRAELDGYAIAFVTDTHNISARRLEMAVTEINKQPPDLLILGGDFSSRDKAMERSIKILANVKTIDGIYGVEGTHDNYIKLFAAMKRCDMHPLSNSGVLLRRGFFLAGVEDVKNRRPDVKKALERARRDDFTLLISHNPDVTMMQDTAPADLVLSGHIHGGHITFFGIWAPALTIYKNVTMYGSMFMKGWATSRDGIPVYVSNGLGSFLFVPRIFARPQVVIIKLISGCGGDKKFNQRQAP